MNRQQGLSLLELIIALAILVIVLGLASAGVILALRAQSGQEAVTSSQAKLRRVNEAVLQELRGAVLGGVTSTPIVSGPNSVSFTVMDGGAGYAVQGLTNSQVTVIAPNNLETDDFAGTQILLVNNLGEARVLDVTNAAGGGGNNVFNLNHATCRIPFPSTDDILMFKVRTVGFRYDGPERTLYQQVGNGGELPLAYNMARFDVSYVYQRDDNSTYINNPIPDLDGDNQPDRKGDIGGAAVQLARLNITLGTTAPSFGGRTVSRQYTGQLELLNNANNESFRAVSRVVPCN